MMARSTNDIPHSRSVKRGLVALTGFTALLVASTYLPETPKPPPPPPPSPERARAVISLIRSADYDCDEVYLIEPAARFPHKGITVLCKNRYSFLVENHGGRLIVTSQSDWY